MSATVPDRCAEALAEPLRVAYELGGMLTLLVTSTPGPAMLGLPMFPKVEGPRPEKPAITLLTSKAPAL